VSIAAAEEIKKRWGGNIRRRRDELRMTQTALAQATGCSQAAISRMEQGLVEIPVDTGLRIADALATTFPALFTVEQTGATP
jgi:transcriptional regulator with XRE-family HTH domain